MFWCPTVDQDVDLYLVKSPQPRPSGGWPISIANVSVPEIAQYLGATSAMSTVQWDSSGCGVVFLCFPS